jgi:hypothetical protein
MMTQVARVIFKFVHLPCAASLSLCPSTYQQTAIKMAPIETATMASQDEALGAAQPPDGGVLQKLAAELRIRIYGYIVIPPRTAISPSGQPFLLKLRFILESPRCLTGSKKPEARPIGPCATAFVKDIKSLLAVNKQVNKEASFVFYQGVPTAASSVS